MPITLSDYVPCISAHSQACLPTCLPAYTPNNTAHRPIVYP